MKNKIIVFVIICLLIQACKENNQTSQTTIIEKVEVEEKEQIESGFKSLLKPNEKLKLGKKYKDTVNYVNFNDEGEQ